MNGTRAIDAEATLGTTETGGQEKNAPSQKTDDRGEWLRIIGRALTAFGTGASITPVVGWLLSQPALFLGRMCLFLGRLSGTVQTGAGGAARGGVGGLPFGLFKSELPESLLEWVFIPIVFVAGLVAPLGLLILIIMLLIFAIFG